MWNGRNYVLQMTADMDFLATVPPLADAVSFDLQRNPFTMPASLDGLSRYVQDALDETKSGDGRDRIEGGCDEIGESCERVMQQGHSNGVTENAAHATTHEAKFATEKKRDMVSKATKTDTGAHQWILAHGLDATRVRAAAELMLDEERLFGKWYDGACEPQRSMAHPGADPGTVGRGSRGRKGKLHQRHQAHMQRFQQQQRHQIDQTPAAGIGVLPTDIAYLSPDQRLQIQQYRVLQMQLREVRLQLVVFLFRLYYALYRPGYFSHVRRVLSIACVEYICAVPFVFLLGLHRGDCVAADCLLPVSWQLAKERHGGDGIALQRCTPTPPRPRRFRRVLQSHGGTSLAVPKSFELQAPRGCQSTEEVQQGPQQRALHQQLDMLNQRRAAAVRAAAEAEKTLLGALKVSVIKREAAAAVTAAEEYRARRAAQDAVSRATAAAYVTAELAHAIRKVGERQSRGRELPNVAHTAPTDATRPPPPPSPFTTAGVAAITTESVEDYAVQMGRNGRRNDADHTRRRKRGWIRDRRSCILPVRVRMAAHSLSGMSRVFNMESIL